MFCGPEFLGIIPTLGDHHCSLSRTMLACTVHILHYMPMFTSSKHMALKKWYKKCHCALMHITSLKNNVPLNLVYGRLVL